MLPRRLSPDDAPSASSEKFEDLLGRLEQIVADMENAEMPLEKLLAGYEEGMRLVKACGDRLTDAEQKVEILSRPLSADALKTVALAAESAKQAPAGEIVPPKAEEEIRLF